MIAGAWAVEAVENEATEVAVAVALATAAVGGVAAAVADAGAAVAGSRRPGSPKRSSAVSYRARTS